MDAVCDMSEQPRRSFSNFSNILKFEKCGYLNFGFTAITGQKTLRLDGRDPTKSGHRGMPPDIGPS